MSPRCACACSTPLLPWACRSLGPGCDPCKTMVCVLNKARAAGPMQGKEGLLGQIVRSQSALAEPLEQMWSCSPQWA